MSVHNFPNIDLLKPGFSVPAYLGIDFNDSTSPVNFEIISSLGKSYKRYFRKVYGNEIF